MMRAILLLSSFAVSAQISAAPLPNLPGGPPWPSGVGSISTIEGYKTWASWMGYQPDIVTIWLPTVNTKTWGQLAIGTSSATFNYYLKDAMEMLPASVPIVISQPMVPNDKEMSNRACAHPEMWDQYAAGNFDSHWVSWANGLKALAQAHGRNPANHIMRLGWEMNGNWYPWSICNNVSEFKASWERVHRIVTGIIPGMMFDFSPAAPYVGYTASFNYGGPPSTHPGVNLMGFLPDSDTFDVISVSLHDNSPIIVDEKTWEEHVFPKPSDREVGLGEGLNAAIAHNKKFALSEWSINYLANCDYSKVPSAQPAFIFTKVHEFLTANAGRIAWDTYFSPACAAMYPTAKQTSPAARKYKELWGRDNQESAAPKPPQLISVL